MQLLARIRTFLARHPAVYWLLVSALLIPLAASVHAKIRGLDQARHSWGETRTVWVVTGPIAVGDRVTVTRRELPAAAVPVDAVTASPEGRTAVQRITTGEQVTVADVGDGLVDALPDGWLGVAVPITSARLPLRPGDHVTVYGAGTMLADDALVLDVTAASVALAIPAAQTAAVGEAARLQVAVLALRRP